MKKKIIVALSMLVAMATVAPAVAAPAMATVYPATVYPATAADATPVKTKSHRLLKASTHTLSGSFLPECIQPAYSPCIDAITLGTNQLLLRRPILYDTLTYDTLYNISTEIDARYSDYSLPIPTAYTEGYYTYTYKALNSDKTIFDSLFVSFLNEHEQDSSLENKTKMPLVVNVVVIDHKGYTTFKLLNLDYYDNVKLNLYDKRGLCIYRSLSYNNNYDMSHLPADTYFFDLEAQKAQDIIKHKGFVELIKK